MGDWFLIMVIISTTQAVEPSMPQDTPSPESIPSAAYAHREYAPLSLSPHPILPGYPYAQIPIATDDDKSDADRSPGRGVGSDEGPDTLSADFDSDDEISQLSNALASMSIGGSDTPLLPHPELETMNSLENDLIFQGVSRSTWAYLVYSNCFRYIRGRYNPLAKRRRGCGR